MLFDHPCVSCEDVYKRQDQSQSKLQQGIYREVRRRHPQQAEEMCIRDRHPPKRVGALYLCSFSAKIRPGDGGEENVPVLFIFPGAFAVLH